MLTTAPVERVLPFLESRQYLHGTTLYATLTEYLPATAQVCYKIMKIISSPRIRVWIDPAEDAAITASASLHWTDGSAQGRILVEELSPPEAVVRDPYPEDLITRAASIDDDRIQFEGASPFDFVATAVPLFKALLGHHGHVYEDGAWMFTRLDAQRARTSFTRIELALESVLAKRVAKSRIELDGAPFGYIYYSWVTKRGR